MQTLAASFAASALIQMLLLISGIITSRGLGPLGRGEYALVWIALAVVTQLGGLGWPLALTYFRARNLGDGRQIWKQMRAPVLAQIGTLVACFTVAVLAFVNIYGESVRLAALCAVPLVVALLIQHYSLAFLQASPRSCLFHSARVLPQIAVTVAVLVLAVTGRMTVARLTFEVSLWSMAAAGTLVVMASRDMRYCESNGRETECPRFSAIARFGLKGFWGSISPAETFRLDQLLVGTLLNTTSLGLYTAGVAMSNLPRFIGHSIGVVAYPEVSRSDPKGILKEVCMWFLISLVLCGLVAGALICTVGTLIPIAFGHEFAAAVVPARWLTASSFILSVRRVATDALRGAGLPEAATYGECALWASVAVGALALRGQYELRTISMILTASSAVSFSAVFAFAAVRYSEFFPTEVRLQT